MVEDKIAAMWEEDGDLKLLQNFFDTLSQDQNRKERIKIKTIEKIAASNNQEQDAIKEERRPGIIKEKEIPPNNKKKNFFQISNFKNPLKNKKNTLKLFSAAAVVVLAVYLGTSGLLMPGDSPTRDGYGSAENKTAQDTGMINGSMTAPAAPDSAPELFSSTEKSESRQSIEESGSIANDGIMKQKGAGQKDTDIAPEAVDTKIIYTLEASLKTDDVLASVAQVEEKVQSVGGYIAESRQNNEQDQTNAYLTLKVPVTEFESFKGSLAEFGTVSNQNLFTDDISLEYYDVETRLKSWEAQEQRYLEILKEAKSVEDILKIEDSLANVRREMESLKGQLKYWDNRVEYSEIRLNIFPSQSNLSVHDPWQPISLQSTFNAAKNAVIKSVSFLWNSLNYFVVFIGYAFPIGVILAGAWLIYRWVKRSKKVQ